MSARKINARALGALWRLSRESGAAAPVMMLSAWYLPGALRVRHRHVETGLNAKNRAYGENVARRPAGRRRLAMAARLIVIKREKVSRAAA